MMILRSFLSSIFSPSFFSYDEDDDDESRNRCGPKNESVNMSINHITNKRLRVEKLFRFICFFFHKENLKEKATKDDTKQGSFGCYISKSQ